VDRSGTEPDAGKKEIMRDKEQDKKLDKIQDAAIDIEVKRIYALLDKIEAVHKKVAAEAAGVADALRVGASRKDRAAFASVARWLELIDREQKPFTQKNQWVKPEAILNASGVLSRLKQINPANPDPRAVETLVQLILSFRKISARHLDELPVLRKETQEEISRLLTAKTFRRIARNAGL
jgi:hypothetical protein